jgi:hypothetical protein
MFERLLAALIILALLVLVMFIALPETAVNNRPTSVSGTPPTRFEPNITPPSDSAKLKPPVETTPPAETTPPVEKETTVAKNEPPAKAPGTEVPPPPEKAPVDALKDRVPNPPAHGVESAVEPPAATPTQDREVAGGDAPRKQKFVKYYLDRMPITPAVEPHPRPQSTMRYDTPSVESPAVSAPRPDRSRLQALPRRTAQRHTQPMLVRSDGEGDNDMGNYVRDAEYDAPGRNRTGYSECAEGRCDCDCERPYWARRGPPCWD